jgi:hypothetical protein
MLGMYNEWSTLDGHSMMIDHIFRTHSEAETQLYRQMGGFWAAMPSSIHEAGK